MEVRVGGQSWKSKLDGSWRAVTDLVRIADLVFAGVLLGGAVEEDAGGGDHGVEVVEAALLSPTLLTHRRHLPR